MTAREYLSNFQKFKVIAEQFEGEKKSLLRAEKAEFPKNKKKVQNLIEEVETGIKSAIGEYEKAVKLVQELDNGLYADFLFKKYVEDKSLLKISMEMNYSEVYMKEFHGKALKAFESKYIDFLQKRGEG